MKSAIAALLVTRGRLRRRDFWLISLGLAALCFFIQVVGATLILGDGFVGLSALLELGKLSAESPRFIIAAGFLLSIGAIFYWPMLALCLRRDHDRDNSGKLALLYFCGALLSDFLNFGYRLLPEKLEPVFEMLWTGGGILNWALLGVAVWLTVTLGLLDGTPGPNRYGPSPKGIGQTD